MGDGTDPGLLIKIGVKAPELFAGFCGGSVTALALRDRDPISIISSMVVGALVANYLSVPFGHYLGLEQGTAGFVVGVGGMAIIQGILAASKKWSPFNQGSGNNNAGTGN
jgi:predicted MFS family arabinose efflux permease